MQMAHQFSSFERRGCRAQSQAFDDIDDDHGAAEHHKELGITFQLLA